MSQAVHQRGWIRHGALTWRDYFAFNTDHKVIGVQYMALSFAFFLIAGLLSLLMRVQLARPGNQFVSPARFDNLFSVHGTMMIFFWIIPVFTGLANYVLPLMLGAQDMAFPRMNALSFWMLVPSALLQLATLIVPGNESGWSAYAPLSIQTGPGQTLWALSLFILGFASIFAAVNLIVTIINYRAPGMTFRRMPLFSWSMLATAAQIIVGTPVLAVALALLILDRELGAHFFRATGDPLMWQNYFWFYSHPAVYIMILPGFGLISDVIPPLVRRPIFGYMLIAVSSLAISFFGFGVWAHHMFTSGMNPVLRIPFMVISMIIAVPTGIKIFSWLATMWGGRLNLKTPLLFVIGFIATFVIGGLSGVSLAAVPIDIHVDDSYYLVAHLHYVLFGGSVMCVYAGLYYWLPKITGRMLNETLGRVHFWLTFIGFNLTFMPMFFYGLAGMPRRVLTYPSSFASGNLLATVGAFILGPSTLLFVANFFLSLRRGPLAGPNPWRALTLEWTLSSPPPVHNFAQVPIVTSDPYGYDEEPSPGLAGVGTEETKGAPSR